MLKINQKISSYDSIIIGGFFKKSPNFFPHTKFVTSIKLGDFFNFFGLLRISELNKILWTHSVLHLTKCIYFTTPKLRPQKLYVCFATFFSK